MEIFDDFSRKRSRRSQLQSQELWVVQTRRFGRWPEAPSCMIGAATAFDWQSAPASWTLSTSPTTGRDSQGGLRKTKFLIMSGYIAYLVPWYPRRMRRRLVRCWETYDLEIGPDYLLRRQADIPDLRVQFDEFRAAEHVQGRYLRVMARAKGVSWSSQKVLTNLARFGRPFPLFARSAYGR